MVEQNSQLQRLQAEKQKLESTGSMTAISAVALDVGIPIREHFPDLKDANGKTLKDDRGFAKKGDKPDGYSITLAVFGKKQFVQLVMPKPVKLNPGVAYRVTGFGYDMRENFYVKREGRISVY